MIDWAPDAIEAAHRAMFKEPYDGTTAAMIGAGLDAAAASQGMPTDSAITILRGQVEALNNERDRLRAEKLITQGEVTRLREENAHLRGALKPFSDRLNDIEKMKASKYACATSVEIEHLRAAAAAIRKGGKDG